jgi:hypothetical protein
MIILLARLGRSGTQQVLTVNVAGTIIVEKTSTALRTLGNLSDSPAAKTDEYVLSILRRDQAIITDMLSKQLHGEISHLPTIESLSTVQVSIQFDAGSIAIVGFIFLAVSTVADVYGAYQAIEKIVEVVHKRVIKGRLGDQGIQVQVSVSGQLSPPRNNVSSAAFAGHDWLLRVILILLMVVVGFVLLLTMGLLMLIMIEL